MKLSIIIPCYNEQRYVDTLIDKVKKVQLPQGFEKEIIVIDDGSTDATGALLERFQPDITLIKKAKNEGKGAAVKLGLQSVTGDYVIIQDADLEYSPDEYNTLLQPVIDKKAEVVFGSRNLKKDNVIFSNFFYIGSLFLTKLFNMCFRSSYTDIFSCYKLFPASYINDLIFLPSNDFVFDGIELTHVLTQKTKKYCEVPVSYTSRNFKEGKKIGVVDGIKSLLSIIRIFFKIDAFIRDMRVKKALQVVKPNTNVLDIGCGVECYFLRKIKNIVTHAYGIDKKLQDWKSDTITIQSFDFDAFVTFPFQDNFFDHITSLAVLEHVYHPEFMLEQAYRCLKPGGEIIITTPSRGAKPILEFLAFRLKLIDEEEIRDHKHYFSKQELLCLFNKIGFVEVKHSYFEFRLNHVVRAKKI